jgi:WD40 repeat protein
MSPLPLARQLSLLPLARYQGPHEAASKACRMTNTPNAARCSLFLPSLQATLQLLLTLWLLLTAGQLPAQQLKLVPQTVGRGAFDAADWTPDGRWLVSAGGPERLVRIWDPQNGPIIDTIRLPLTGTRPDEVLQIQDLRVAPDGRTAQVRVIAASEDPAIGPETYATVIYTVDLLGRTATIQSRVPLPEKPASFAADAPRPDLPAAPDGRRLARTEAEVLEILGKDGALIRRLGGPEPVQTDWITLSPDGRLALFLSRPTERQVQNERTDWQAVIKEGKATRVVPFDIASGRYLESRMLTEFYGRAGWLGPRKILISEESSAFGRDPNVGLATKGKPAPAYVIDLSRNEAPQEIRPRCFIQPLGRDGMMIGAGLSNCRQDQPTDRGIWIAETDGFWMLLPTVLDEGSTIDGLRASPDGRLIAVAVGRNDQATAILLVDSDTGDILHRLRIDGPIVTAFNFLPDSRSLVIMGDGKAMLWRFADGRVELLPTTAFDPSLMVSDGTTLLVSGALNGQLQRIALDGRGLLPPLEGISALAGGYLPDRKLFWVGTATGELIFFDSTGGTRVATLQRYLYDTFEYFLVHDPVGRYDTDLPPDNARFRWLVMDAPFQSLSPVAFMRELYTPDLLDRTLACRADGSCDTALRVAVDVGAINRSLPTIDESISVGPGTKRGMVDVRLTVREGVNDRPSGAYMMARSGIHNLRLFRDDVLVAEKGVFAANGDATDKAGWRAATRLVPNRPDGAVDVIFRNVQVPWDGYGLGETRFSAYAFNEDRVRGPVSAKTFDTEELVRMARMPSEPPPRRLFTLSIGIDSYPGGLFRPLRYAAADARAMASLFASARVKDDAGEEMEDRPLILVPRLLESTGNKPATRAQIAALFAELRQATPNDMILISFSGHGYTDAAGRFYLVPSDVRTNGNSPVPESMISAGDLASWLGGVDAGEIHMVIDACHSAASVQSGTFKPGPMGDPGLGQLAYDKGIRILAASAPDQLAMEDSLLGHGRLTYALVFEGAGQRLAEQDMVGNIGFDRLFTFAADRLTDRPPVNYGSGPGIEVEWSTAPPRPQTPALFDFAHDNSVLHIPARAGGQPAEKLLQR